MYPSFCPKLLNQPSSTLSSNLAKKIFFNPTKSPWNPTKSPWNIEPQNYRAPKGPPHRCRKEPPHVALLQSRGRCHAEPRAKVPRLGELHLGDWHPFAGADATSFFSTFFLAFWGWVASYHYISTEWYMIYVGTFLYTVDGNRCELMDEKLAVDDCEIRTTSLWMVYPIINSFATIQGGARFLPSNAMKHGTRVWTYRKTDFNWIAKDSCKDMCHGFKQHGLLSLLGSHSSYFHRDFRKPSSLDSWGQMAINHKRPMRLDHGTCLDDFLCRWVPLIQRYSLDIPVISRNHIPIILTWPWLPWPWHSRDISPHNGMPYLCNGT